MASCPDAACAVALLRRNGLDAVDGLVLERAEDGDLVLRFTVDDFPDRTRVDQVVFPSGLFAAPCAAQHDVGRLAVVALSREC